MLDDLYALGRLDNLGRPSGPDDPDRLSHPEHLDKLSWPDDSNGLC